LDPEVEAVNGAIELAMAEEITLLLLEGLFSPSLIFVLGITQLFLVL